MKLARVFFDSDMRCSYKGLTKVMRESGIKTERLDKEHLVLFLNRRQTYFKCFIGEQYILSYNNGTRRIPLEAIKFFPQFFDGTQINMKGAIEKMLSQKLERQKNIQ